MFLNPEKYHWTYHARDKMRFYRLSEARVKRVLHSPKRVEEGVAPNTVAMMQPAQIRSNFYQKVRRTWAGKPASAKDGNRSETWKQEIWAMAQSVKSGKGRIIKIISAWRYPGMSKPRSQVIKDLMKKEYQDFTSTGR